MKIIKEQLVERISRAINVSFGKDHYITQGEVNLIYDEIVAFVAGYRPEPDCWACDYMRKNTDNRCPFMKVRARTYAEMVKRQYAKCPLPEKMEKGGEI